MASILTKHYANIFRNKCMFCSFFYFLKDQNKVPKERYVYRTKIIIMQHNNSQTNEALAVNRGMLQRSHKPCRPLTKSYSMSVPPPHSCMPFVLINLFLVYDYLIQAFICIYLNLPYICISELYLYNVYL